MYLCWILYVERVQKYNYPVLCSIHFSFDGKWFSQVELNNSISNQILSALPMRSRRDCHPLFLICPESHWELSMLYNYHIQVSSCIITSSHNFYFSISFFLLIYRNFLYFINDGSESIQFQIFFPVDDLSSNLIHSVSCSKSFTIIFSVPNFFCMFLIYGANKSFSLLIQ